MGMTRQQLRLMAARMRYQAERKKPATRKQIAAWLSPIRKSFAEMRQGEVDSIRGYAVTRLHTGDDYARVDYCINGFVALLDRLMPDLDTQSIKAISRKLANGVLLTLDDIDAASAVIDQAEERLLHIPRETLIYAANVEQIVIELDQAGLREAA